jgi:hypothetical protein
MRFRTSGHLQCSMSALRAEAACRFVSLTHTPHQAVDCFQLQRISLEDYSRTCGCYEQRGNGGMHAYMRSCLWATNQVFLTQLAPGARGELRRRKVVLLCPGSVTGTVHNTQLSLSHILTKCVLFLPV